jgi:ABC-type transport system involved in cytochrome bd biosynthesis fused ATPase/permease subunit
MTFLVSLLPVSDNRSASAKHFLARLMFPVIIAVFVISAKRSAFSQIVAILFFILVMVYFVLSPLRQKVFQKKTKNHKALLTKSLSLSRQKKAIKKAYQNDRLFSKR